jgi:hypothetical protein
LIKGIRKRQGWKEQKNDKNSGNGRYRTHICNKSMSNLAAMHIARTAGASGIAKRIQHSWNR